MGDTETGEFREHDRESEGLSQPGSDLEDEDELRVQRTEEELHAGTREREAGSLRVRKRVRTDREQIEVPTRHEEVTVERVPVEGEASGTEIGDDEVSVPVTEEEVVVEKRPVAKEEVRVRKDVVEDTETVEEDVRREEVDVEDETPPDATCKRLLSERRTGEGRCRGIIWGRPSFEDLKPSETLAGISISRLR